MGMWTPISSAPSGIDLELAVVDAEGVHALVFPCLRQAQAWVSRADGAHLDVSPTHWRRWSDDASEIARRTQEARRGAVS